MRSGHLRLLRHARRDAPSGVRRGTSWSPESATSCPTTCATAGGTTASTASSTTSTRNRVTTTSPGSRRGCAGCSTSAASRDGDEDLRSPACARSARTAIDAYDEVADVLAELRDARARARDLLQLGLGSREAIDAAGPDRRGRRRGVVGVGRRPQAPPPHLRRTCSSSSTRAGPTRCSSATPGPATSKARERRASAGVPTPRALRRRPHPARTQTTPASPPRSLRRPPRPPPLLATAPKSHISCTAQPTAEVGNSRHQMCE